MPIPQNIPPQPQQTAPAPALFPNPQGPEVNFTSEGVIPPSAIYVSPDDTIQVWIRNPTVDVNIHIYYRLLTPSGEIITSEEVLTSAASATTPRVKVIGPSEGFLLSMTLYADCISRGQAFARVFLTRGSATSGIPLDHLLIQGYLSEDDRLGFPQSPTESSLSGRGWSRDVTVSAPAAAQPLTLTVPAGVHWAVRGIRVPFTASAAVANRLITASIFDPTGHCGVSQPLSSYFTAAQTWACSWGSGLTSVALLPLAAAGLPTDLIVSAGWVISVDGQSLDAADQFQAGVICVEEWIGR